MSIKAGNRLKRIGKMPRIDIESLQVQGKGKVKKEGPQPIYLNFRPEDEVYERLEKVRRKHGTGKVKALITVLLKSADF